MIEDIFEILKEQKELTADQISKLDYELLDDAGKKKLIDFFKAVSIKKYKGNLL